MLRHPFDPCFGYLLCFYVSISRKIAPNLQRETQENANPFFAVEKLFAAKRIAICTKMQRYMHQNAVLSLAKRNAICCILPNNKWKTALKCTKIVKKHHFWCNCPMKNDKLTSTLPLQSPYS